MTTQKRLSSNDREFFSHVADAVFTNPFSKKRAEKDALIAGSPQTMESYVSFERAPFMPRLTQRVEKLEQAGFEKINDFIKQDQEIIKYAYLFYIFHKYVERLDDQIQAQLKHGEAPLTVPFARSLLADLRRKGFSKEASLRYFAHFYQLRRAFFFIVKGLKGKSPPMKKIRRALWNNVFTFEISLYDQYLWNRMEDFSTLLLGETGTGKGTAAAAIGRSGFIPFNESKNAFEESFTASFLSINLSQYPESLIESELFGHRKGSFTGAVDNHEGLFARGSAYGALFLDEIGEVSIPVQIKLLQVIQERTFSPVGSHAQKRFRGRIITATNKRIPELRAEGGFRDDFFYRISSDVIVIPPLRQRLTEDPEEMGELVNLMVERILGEASPKISKLVEETLVKDLPKDYPWPGNVRELEQATRRILLTGHYYGENLPQAPSLQDSLIQGIENGDLNAKELMSKYCALLYERCSSYEEVARRTELDRRTAKKHIETRKDP